MSQGMGISETKGKSRALFSGDKFISRVFCKFRIFVGLCELDFTESSWRFFEVDLGSFNVIRRC